MHAAHLRVDLVDKQLRVGKRQAECLLRDDLLTQLRKRVVCTRHHGLDEADQPRAHTVRRRRRHLHVG